MSSTRTSQNRSGESEIAMELDACADNELIVSLINTGAKDGVKREWHELKPLAPTGQTASAWGKALGINGLKT